MKPLVYYDFKEFDADPNFVLVDKKRLQEILEEVYNAGFSDGSKSNSVTVPTYGNWRYPLRGDEITCGEINTNTPIAKRGVTITCDTETNSNS